MQGKLKSIMKQEEVLCKGALYMLRFGGFISVK